MTKTLHKVQKKTIYLFTYDTSKVSFFHSIIDSSQLNDIEFHIYDNIDQIIENNVTFPTLLIVVNNEFDMNIELLKMLSVKFKNTPTIIISEQFNLNHGLNYLRNGASDYLSLTDLTREKFIFSILSIIEKEKIVLGKEKDTIVFNSEKLLKTLIENVTDSIYFKDKDSRFILFNKATLTKFGFNSELELLGKSDSELFGEEHAIEALNDEKSIIQTGKSITNKVEKENWKDGSVTWVTTSKYPLVDDDGNIVGTFGITRDITELKLAEQNYLEQKTKAELLFKIVPGAIFTVDLNQNITSFNYMAEKVTGYSAEEVIGKHCSLFTEKTCKNHCGLFDLQIKKPQMNVVCIIRTKTGEERFISKNVDYLNDFNGNIIGGIESFEDITERKIAEDKIKNYTTELQELNSTKDRFFSIIAHDLRNPFTAILGLIDLLSFEYKDFTDEERIEVIRDVREAAHSSYRLLENLLTWSKSQQGKIEVVIESFNLKNLVEESIEPIRPNANNKNIIIEMEINDNHIVMADKFLIVTIFRNLVSNAIKFTNKNGNVKILSRIKDDLIEVCVKDTGMGMRSEDVKKLFRIDNHQSQLGTKNERGTGLGLIISKEFIEKQGGTIRAESSLGIGSEFCVTLRNASNI